MAADAAHPIPVRWVVLLLLVMCAALYAHTLDVPMYLDDISSISDNPAIHDPADWAAIREFSAMRFAGYLSFALNYAVHGPDVAGYHVVNAAIHFAVALVLYLLVMALGRSPGLSAGRGGWPLQWMALAAALLFLVHPLHTQAVTYIVQRLASLTALFYLLAVFAYVRTRLTNGVPRWAWLFLCVTAAVLALFTKQNAATLPVSLVLVEYLFFAVDGVSRRRLLLGVLLAVVAGCLTLLALELAGTQLLQTLDTLTRESGRIARIDYFASQQLVLWRYLGLFFWPHPLVLDYGLEPQLRFTDWQVLVAVAGHVALLALALAAGRRAPLVAFGILFYYVAHAVESGIIPIKDLMFEHRTYLPDIGLSIAVAALLARLPWRLAVPAGLCVLLVLSALTWQRNNLWRDQVAFYSDAIRHAPNQPRNWVFLSKVYHKAGENRTALEFLLKELAANEQRHGRLRVDSATLVYWAKLLRLNGEVERAAEIEAYAESVSTPVERLRMKLHRGNSHLEAGEYAEAAEVYRQILEISPRQSSAAVNLGVVELMLGDYQAAIDIFEQYPDHPVSQANLPRAREALAGRHRFEGVEEKIIEKAR